MHDVELLGAGEPEQAGLVVCIHGDLDVGQEFRRVLNLVDEPRVAGNAA